MCETHVITDYTMKPFDALLLKIDSVCVVSHLSHNRGLCVSSRVSADGVTTTQPPKRGVGTIALWPPSHVSRLNGH